MASQHTNRITASGVGGQVQRLNVALDSQLGQARRGVIHLRLLSRLRPRRFRSPLAIKRSPPPPPPMNIHDLIDSWLAQYCSNINL